MSRRKKALLICLGLLLLWGAGAAGLVYFLYQSFRGPTEAANRFLSLIGQDKARDAYAMTAADFRTGLDEPSFVGGVRPTGLPDYASVSWNNWRSSNGITTIKGVVTTRKATSIPVALKLVNEDGQWKILAMSPTPVAGTPDVGHAAKREDVPSTPKISDDRRSIGQAHDDAVRCVVFSPDAKQILSGGGTIVRLWDVDSCREVARYEGHIGAVRGVAFAGDGQHILTASEDQTLRVWDVASRKEVRSVKILSNPKGVVAFSADGRLALAGGLVDRTPSLWDVESGKPVRPFDGIHVSGVYSLAFSPDGRRALSGGFDRGGVRVWDVGTGKEVARFRLDAGATEGTTAACAFSPDGKRAVISGGVSPSPSVWDAERGQRLLLLKSPPGATHAVAFSPDGGRILTGGDGTVCLFDASSGAELSRMTGHTGEVFAVAFSPDGRWAVSGGADRSLRLWKLPGEAPAEQVGGE
jgi:WD40 repeat protein